MVGHSVPWVAGYFSEKKWYDLIPCRLQQKEIRAFGDIISQYNQTSGDTIILPQDNLGPTKEGAWGCYFNAYPHSNVALRKIIPLAQDDLVSSLDDTSYWTKLTDLPLRVLEWLQGLGEIILSPTPISNFDDSSQILESILLRHQATYQTGLRPLKQVLIDFDPEPYLQPRGFFNENCL